MPFDIALKKPTKKPVIASDSDGESTEESVASLQDTHKSVLLMVFQKENLFWATIDHERGSQQNARSHVPSKHGSPTALCEKNCRLCSLQDQRHAPNPDDAAQKEAGKFLKK